MTDAFDSALAQLVTAYGDIHAGLPSAKLRRVAELIAALGATVANDADKQLLTSLHDRLQQEVQALEHRRVELKAFRMQARPAGGLPGHDGLPGLSVDQATAFGAVPGHTQPGTVPPAKVEEFKNLYELFAKAGDAAARSAAVKAIRDFLAGIAFWSSKQDAAAWLDDKIRTGTPPVIQIAMQELFKAVTGHDAPDPTVDIITPEARGEHLYHTPKLTLPGDKPPPVPERTTFELSGVHASYAPGAGISLTLVPPKHFYEINGGKRVSIVAGADRKRMDATRLAEHEIVSADRQTLALTAPAEAGKYALRVEIGLSFEDESMVDFEVTGGS